MKSTVFKLGNSNAIRLSKTMMEALDLKTDDEIEISISDHKLTIEKSYKRKSIEDLFAGYEGEYHTIEFFDDKAKGKELL
ncbi:MAG: hypothetical protein Q4D13_09130 [Erysipelotrichaceae bacterium]|nr:hypothetical protein [Erysipelotrichaceae bacterium]